MVPRKLKLTGYLFGLTLFTILFYALRVVAADEGGGGDGADIGDLAAGFGIAGAVLFALTALTGLVIFLNQRPPFQGLFKKLNVRMKFFFKIHHPLMIATIGTWAGHALAIYYGGAWNLASYGLLIGWVALLAMSFLIGSGLLFSAMKSATRRKVIRYLHLSLMILIVIFVGSHVLLAED